jgi:drug/metabolite transporter (DMT)-like permease
MWHRWAAIAVGFVGVLVAVQPGQAALPLVGVAIGLAAAFGTATVVITLRQIGETERPAATVFWFNVVCVLATALPMPFLFKAQSPDIWLALVAGGLFGGAAQIMMTSALRYAPVSVLAPFDYLQIVWATLWSLFLFHTAPTHTSLIGAALITAAGCYVIWRERRLRKAG